MPWRGRRRVQTGLLLAVSLALMACSGSGGPGKDSTDAQASAEAKRPPVGEQREQPSRCSAASTVARLAGVTDVEFDPSAAPPAGAAIYCVYRGSELFWDLTRIDNIAQPASAVEMTFKELKSRCVDNPHTCSKSYTYSIQWRDAGDRSFVYKEIFDTSSAPHPRGYLAAGRAVLGSGSSVCTTNVIYPGLPTRDAAEKHLDRSLALSRLGCGVSVNGLSQEEKSATELPMTLPSAPPEALALLQRPWILKVTDPFLGGEYRVEFRRDGTGIEHLGDGSTIDFTWALANNTLTICVGGRVTAPRGCNITYTGTLQADGTYAGRASTGPNSDFAWVIRPSP